MTLLRPLTFTDCGVRSKFNVNTCTLYEKLNIAYILQHLSICVL